ncbi:MAG: 50S ribosomal protein L11 methyltransferase [Pseudomonadota bacterium]
MSTLWRLTALGPLAALRAANDRLNALEEAPGLGYSLFEDGEPGGGRFDALFDGAIDADAFVERAGLNAPGVEIDFGPLPEADWVAMSLAGLPPVEAGRFVVHGSHTDVEALTDGAQPILIEAGPAFGTGHHGTTKGCLIALDRLERGAPAPKRVLDLGCGTGALAIAAAMLWPRAEIIASDIDPEAVAETDINADKNGMAARISAWTADGFDHEALNGPFDLILANILAGPLQELARALSARLTPGGVTVLSGLLEEQEAAVRAAYEAEDLTLLERDSLDGWVILSFRAG